MLEAGAFSPKIAVNLLAAFPGVQGLARAFPRRERIGHSRQVLVRGAGRDQTVVRRNGHDGKLASLDLGGKKNVFENVFPSIKRCGSCRNVARVKSLVLLSELRS